MTEYVVEYKEYESLTGMVFCQPLARKEEIVRCRDCRHATISSLGLCKYCEKFVLPDEDGFGPDPKVNLPLDFFCAYGERRES